MLADVNESYLQLYELFCSELIKLPFIVFPKIGSSLHVAVVTKS